MIEQNIVTIPEDWRITYRSNGETVVYEAFSPDGNEKHGWIEGPFHTREAGDPIYSWAPGAHIEDVTDVQGS